MCTIFGRTGILRDIVITCPFIESFDTQWSDADNLGWKQKEKDGPRVGVEPEAVSRGRITQLCRYNTVLRCKKRLKTLILPLVFTGPMARQMATVFAHSMRLIYYQIAIDYTCRPEDAQSALNKVMSRTRELVKSLPPISILDAIRDPANEGSLPPHGLIYLQ